MAMVTYEDVLRDIHRLTAEEQRRLRDALIAIIDGLDERLSSEEQHSIMELRGLGKDLWQRTDSTEYLNHERAAWDG